MGLYQSILDLEASRLRVEQVGNSNETVLTKTVTFRKILRNCVQFVVQVVKNAGKNLEAVVNLKKEINNVLAQTGDLQVLLRAIELSLHDKLPK